MVCLEPEGLMYQESIYLESLRIADQFELNGNVLTLYAESSPILVFEIQSDEPISAEPTVEPEKTVSVDSDSSPTSPSVFEPPEGWNPYQDPVTGISVYIPGDWIVTCIKDGLLA